MTPAPYIAFLGICDRVGKVRNVDPRLSSLNLLGLRREVVTSLYPVRLGPHHLLFAVHRLEAREEFSIVIRSHKHGELICLQVALEPYDIGQVPVDPTARQELMISAEASWTLLPMPLPDPRPVVREPDRFDVIVDELGSQHPIGTLDFFYAPAVPLSPDRVAAIRSNPRGSKFARMEISCNQCASRIRAYTGLEHSGSLELEGYVWYQDLPPSFQCACERTQIDLSYLRESFHAVLGHPLGSEEQELALTNLYEISTLEGIADQFARLLDRDPEESDIQTFFEENPILLHRFTSFRIIKKAPLLNRYQTDFAVLSTTGELFLIELERPGKTLLKTDGGRSADFNHPFDQINDWLHLFRDHRIACLEMMGLKNENVSAVRAVVIIGRDGACDSALLKKLKATDFGGAAFLTYDDLLHGLQSLIREVKGI